MFDLVIRGGTVVDGSGRPAVLADVAIKDGVIAEVDRVGPGRRELGAGGGWSRQGGSTSTRTTTVRSPGTHCSRPHRGMASRPS